MAFAISSCKQLQGCRALKTHRRAQPSLRAPRGRTIVAPKALFGGQGGNFDMGKLMENVKKAQELVQKKTSEVQQELAATEFDGYDEDETVRVVMTGNQEPKSVDITQAAMDSGPEELSRRVTVAMREAHGKSVAGMKEKMKELASSLGLPAGAASQLNM